jgi:hypothetical protein
MTPPPIRQIEVVRAWIDSARDDRDALDILEPAGPPRVVAFHAQQAVEKLLKALLVAYGVEPEDSHVIGALLGQLHRTWNLARRNLFTWKHEAVGNLEAKVKTFCAVPQLLRFLGEYILFVEREEELQKLVLRQHQTAAVARAVERALDPVRTRGLVWHTQGSGKTYTMIKAAELLFRAPAAEKPTILLMIDRNELEDQMLRNLAAVGLGNVAHAHSIGELNRLLRQDYRGIVVTMIHKFRDMPEKVNVRRNVFVLVAELERNEQRKRDQAARGMDALSYFVLAQLTEGGIAHPNVVVDRVRKAFEERPDWRQSEGELRELRKQVTFAIYAEEDDLDKVTQVVESLFEVLVRSVPQ